MDQAKRRFGKRAEDRQRDQMIPASGDGNGAAGRNALEKFLYFLEGI